MQNLAAPASSLGAGVNILQAAAEPISHIDSANPVRSDYSLPHPPSERSSDKRRNSPKPKAENPSEPKDDDHVIDDYA